MKGLALLTLIFLVTFSSCESSVLKFENKASLRFDGLPHPKVYTVNLDERAEECWMPVVEDFKLIAPKYHQILRNLIPVEVLPLLEKIAASIDEYLPKPYAAEIRGYAELMNISLGDVVIGNIIYEISSFCTSIVVEDDKGRIWHARNLDYAVAHMLKNLTILVNFQRAGKTVYSAVTYAGYVGILTGQKPNSFTITIDERDRGALWMNLLLAILDKNAALAGFLIRDTLEEESDFKSAVKRISDTTTIASAYYIIGGTQPGEGAVITKGRLFPLDVYYLKPKEGRWFLVETNYDHWHEPPKSDDRRTPAIKALNALGALNITTESLFAVLSVHPVLNKKTTYSVVMSASHPEEIRVWIRTDTYNHDGDQNRL